MSIHAEGEEWHETESNKVLCVADFHNSFDIEALNEAVETGDGHIDVGTETASRRVQEREEPGEEPVGIEKENRWLDWVVFSQIG